MIGFGVHSDLLTGNESSFWSYAKSRSYSGRVTTLDDAVLLNKAMHNHPVDTAEIKANKIRSRLKTKAQETAQPLPTLYSWEVSQIVTDPNPDNV